MIKKYFTDTIVVEKWFYHFLYAAIVVDIITDWVRIFAN